MWKKQLIRSIFRRQRWLTGGCLFLSLSLFVSCNFIGRFHLVLDENNSNPCVGISQFDFIITPLEKGREEVVKSQKLAGLDDLFWDDRGNCNLYPGIPLKGVEFGGQHQFTLRGSDSTGTTISEGVTPVFKVEREGSDVQEEIAFTFQRDSKFPIGTLILNFRAGIPSGVDNIKVILKKDAAQNLQQEEKKIRIDPSSPPSFLVITGLKPTKSRGLVVHAQSNSTVIASSIPTSFRIELANNRDYVDTDTLSTIARININFNND